MYVCLCKGITDSQIRSAVADGLTNYRELRQTLGLSSQCGRCAVEARQIFREACPPSINTHTNTQLFYSAVSAVA
jgi:bacterioferritin-associated ferredoxin